MSSSRYIIQPKKYIMILRVPSYKNIISYKPDWFTKEGLVENNRITEIILERMGQIIAVGKVEVR